MQTAAPAYANPIMKKFDAESKDTQMAFLEQLCKTRFVLLCAVIRAFADSEILCIPIIEELKNRGSEDSPEHTFHGVVPGDFFRWRERRMVSIERVCKLDAKLPCIELINSKKCRLCFLGEKG